MQPALLLRIVRQVDDSGLEIVYIDKIHLSLLSGANLHDRMCKPRTWKRLLVLDAEDGPLLRRAENSTKVEEVAC